MEKYLRENFELESKNSSEEAQRRWRSAVNIVKNPRRRFRMVADLDKRGRAEQEKLKIQEKIRIIQKVALTGGEYEPSNEIRQAGFYIDPDKLAFMVRYHDIESLNALKGVEGIARGLSVSLEKGVCPSQLPERQQLYGFNQYVEKPSKSFWTFIWEALQDWTLITLMVCAVLSIGLGIASKGEPVGMYGGVGIILGIFLVVIITAVTDYKQYVQFRDLDKERKKVSVQVIRDGYRQEVSIFDLVVGDIVCIATGDQIPADGIFVSGYSLLIDESSLSGESEPINVNEAYPFLLSGCKVLDGTGNMLVTSVGMRTEWGTLMQTLSVWGEDETPMQVKLNGVSTIVAKIGLLFAVITFVVLMLNFLLEKAFKHEWLHWSSSDALKVLNYFSIAVTLIVVAVPEGLPLAETLSLAFALKKLMNAKALLRHLSACETMGSASCICTDKTGTLTTNHMVVDKIWICEEAQVIRSDNSGHLLKSTLSEGVLSILLQCILQNTSSEVVKGRDGKSIILGTPTEVALLNFGLLLGGDFEAIRLESKIINFEPFNSVRMKTSMLVALPKGGWRAICNGAPEIVLGMCDEIITSTGKPELLSEARVQNIKDVLNGFASEALRTLCLAFQDLDEISNRDSIPGSGYTVIAVIGIKDPLRPGVKNAVETCLAAGITVKMVTGDNINTAKAIAKECGILTDDGIAIEGSDFRSKNPQEMKELIPKIQVMARALPLDKYTLVTQLRKLGEVVAVTGDGANDVPALRESNIGLAMGITGTEVAKENAEIVIMDDNFTTIVNIVRWGRAVYVNIQNFMQFQLTVNAVAVLLSFACACISGSPPLTVVQLLWVNMIVDILGALALATEPPNDRLMKRSPVRRGANFITTTMWKNIIVQSIYQLFILGVLKIFGKQLLKISGADADSVLNTIIFNSFVFCQVFNEINSRETEMTNIFHDILGSRVFIATIVCVVTSQVIIVEFLGAFASTVPLTWQFWLLSILVGSVSMVVGVAIKCIPVDAVENSAVVNYESSYKLLPSGPLLA